MKGYILKEHHYKYCLMLIKERAVTKKGDSPIETLRMGFAHKEEAIRWYLTHEQYYPERIFYAVLYKRTNIFVRALDSVVKFFHDGD